MKLFKISGMYLAAFVLIIASARIILWMAHRDDQLTAGYDVYNTCVEGQYGMSAAAYYQSHGYAPNC